MLRHRIIGLGFDPFPVVGTCFFELAQVSKRDPHELPRMAQTRVMKYRTTEVIVRACDIAQTVIETPQIFVRQCEIRSKSRRPFECFTRLFRVAESALDIAKVIDSEGIVARNLERAQNAASRLLEAPVLTQ